MENNGVWMVEWSENYADCNAVFTEKDRAAAYIEAQANRMGLHNRGFNLIEESIRKDDDGKPNWCIYGFYPDGQYGETEMQTVSYMWYPLNPSVTEI